MKITESELVKGKVLWDMHDGINYIEKKIPGFVLLHTSQIQTDAALEIMRKLFEEDETNGETWLVSSIDIHNKLLYYWEESIMGLHKAVYHYDNRYFGIVTFEIQPQ